MPNLKDIVYCSEEQLKTMASGTPVGDHVYDENDLYITPLGDDIIVGADNSGTKINENNELIVDSTYVKDTVKPDITEVKTIAEKAEVIAKGRATAYVYDTVEALDTDLSNPDFVAKLVKGDNFYIKALDVPDYWWDGTQKQQLETEKPDLSKVVKDVQVGGRTIVTDGVASIPYAGTTTAGLVSVNNEKGVRLLNDTGMLATLGALGTDISNRTENLSPYASGINTCRPIVPSTLDYAVKQAMCDGKGAAWTNEEKIAARDRLGINDAITEALSAIGVAEERTY